MQGAVIYMHAFNYLSTFPAEKVERIFPYAFSTLEMIMSLEKVQCGYLESM